MDWVTLFRGVIIASPKGTFWGGRLVVGCGMCGLALGLGTGIKRFSILPKHHPVSAASYWGAGYWFVWGDLFTPPPPLVPPGSGPEQWPYSSPPHSLFLDRVACRDHSHSDRSPPVG